MPRERRSGRRDDRRGQRDGLRGPRDGDATRPRARAPRSGPPQESAEVIEGRQPVREALLAGRPIRRLLVAEGAHEHGTLDEIVRLAHNAGVRVDRVPRQLLDQRAVTRAHQGIVAEAAPYRTRSWHEGLEHARSAGRVPLLLALDGIQDPQNAGAILRSAEVFGVDAVLLPSRRSVPLTATVGKASAGAIEHLVIDQVTNLERALSACKEEGLWIVALAGDGDVLLSECALLDEPAVIVVGGEGKGVSALIRSRADAVVRIPTAGKVASLNASAAAAVTLWEVARRRT